MTRGWMGVQIQTVTADIADGLGLRKAEGAVVSEPQGDSPAAKAGIMSGDVKTTLGRAPEIRAIIRDLHFGSPGHAAPRHNVAAVTPGSDDAFVGPAHTALAERVPDHRLSRITDRRSVRSATADVAWR